MPVNTNHWDVYYAKIIETDHPLAKDIIHYFQNQVGQLKAGKKLYTTNNLALFEDGIYQDTYNYFWQQLEAQIKLMPTDKQKQYYQTYQNQTSDAFKTDINYCIQEHLNNYTFGMHTNKDFNLPKYCQFYQQITEHLNFSVVTKTDVFKIIKMYEQQFVRILTDN